MRVCLLHPCDFCKAEIGRECGEPKRFCSLTDIATDDIGNVLMSDEVI